jgi:hypothetical protein
MKKLYSITLDYLKRIKMIPRSLVSQGYLDVYSELLQSATQIRNVDVERLHSSTNASTL